MKISVVKPSRGKIRNLVVFAKGRSLLGPWKKVDPGIEKQVLAQAKLEKFEGKPGQTLVVYPGGSVSRVIAVGVDGKPAWGNEYLRRAASILHQKAKGIGATELTVVLPQAGDAQAVVEGLMLTAYSFGKYKTKGDKGEEGLKKAVLVAAKNAEAAAAAKRGELYAEGTCATRDLVNEPAGVMTPRRLGEYARKNCKGMRVRVFDEKWIEKKGMNALRAVSRGSSQPPRFVHMDYRGPGAKKSVAIVGKGITFDSGGLCIKSAEGMLQMKADMAGAATVAGLMTVVARLKPRVHVHAIFGACENMPGQGAYKMRDVLKAMNGKTMEITNTDAEGRVALSDALSYASTLKPDAIIDMATLTGACVVALGPKYAGIFGTNQKLVDRIRKAATEVGERIWQLPLEEEYFEDYLKSDVADMKNSGGRFGGAIQGALFLQQFVDPKIAWAHIDMAGAAIWPGGKHYIQSGASGMITRTILRFLESYG